MKILPISDLHLEFYEPKQAFAIIDSLANADIAILAGDICNDYRIFNDYIEWFCIKYPYVVFIPGNHEFWGKTFEAVWKNLNDLANQFKNFYPLRNQLIDIKGKKIFGTTDFPGIPNGWNHSSIDLRRMIIPKLWWDDEVKLADNYLNVLCGKVDNSGPDIVITHYMPSSKGISPRFRSSDINWYFCKYRDSLLKHVKKPTTWIAGHTHCATQHQVGNVKVIINPMGYPNEQKDFFPDEKFNKDLIIEV